MNNTNYLVVIAGPTAVGKTSLSISLAKYFKTVIISADSRQFYKEMPIGTAQPCRKELEEIKHFFIASHSVHHSINASDYEKESLMLLDKFFKTNNIVIASGGSGLYIDALCNGFDTEMPDADFEIREQLNNILQTGGINALQNLLLEKDPIFYAKVDLQNSKRLLRALEVCLITGKPYSSLRKGIKNKRSFKTIKIAVTENIESLYQKINNRTDIMFQEGLVEEAKNLFEFKKYTPLKTVGYKELFLHFEGKISLEEAKEEIKKNTRRYARRQLTWLRRDKEYAWFTKNQLEEIIQYITKNTTCV